jgi:hypothetical protein
MRIVRNKVSHEYIENIIVKNYEKIAIEFFEEITKSYKSILYNIKE